MLTRLTLRQPFKARAGLSVAPAVSIQLRTYKKEKIDASKIEAAKKIQARQSKTYVQKYYSKWGRKKIQGEKASKKKQDEEEDDDDGKEMTANEFRTWNRERREAHLNLWQDQNDPSLSIEARIKAAELHLQEPHFWTPVRLAALFKCNIDYMRCFLFEAKMAGEAKAMGDNYVKTETDKQDFEYVAGRVYELEEYELKELKDDIIYQPAPWDDWEIDQEFANIFGMVDYPNTFSDPPEDIPIKKIHNPWYFVDPGMRSGELLKFVRARETRHYRECSRIPQQQYPKMKEYKEVLGDGVVQRKFPNKKIKFTMYDSSPQYNLYNRPILIRDHDNTWRNPTWAERRKIFMSRKQVRYPTKVPFVYPDETQPDKRAIQDKPPASFHFYNPIHEQEDLDHEQEEMANLFEDQDPELEGEIATDEIESDREYLRKMMHKKVVFEGNQTEDGEDFEDETGGSDGEEEDPFPFQSRYQTQYEY